MGAGGEGGIRGVGGGEGVWGSLQHRPAERETGFYIITYTWATQAG